MKILVGADTSLNLKQLDLWYGSSMEMDITKGKNPNCPTCGNHHFEFLDCSSLQQVAYSILCGRDTVQINFRQKEQLDLSKLADQLRKSGRVSVNEFLLRFSPDEKNVIVLFKDSQALVNGTNDIARAKSLYAKYFGS